MSSTVGWAEAAGEPILGSVGTVETGGVVSVCCRTGVTAGPETGSSSNVPMFGDTVETDSCWSSIHGEAVVAGLTAINKLVGKCIYI
jgi:hypothetical protein